MTADGEDPRPVAPSAPSASAPLLTPGDDAVLVVAVRNGRLDVEVANESARLLFGLGAEGHAVLDDNAPQHVRPLVARVHSAAGRQRATRERLILRPADGGPFPVDLRLEPMSGTDDAPRVLVVAARPGSRAHRHRARRGPRRVRPRRHGARARNDGCRHVPHRAGARRGVRRRHRARAPWPVARAGARPGLARRAASGRPSPCRGGVLRPERGRRWLRRGVPCAPQRSRRALGAHPGRSRARRRRQCRRLHGFARGRHRRPAG